MEDSRILTKRRWRLLRKSQVIAACLGAGMTLIVVALEITGLFPGRYSFYVFMAVVALPTWVAYSLGIGPSGWGMLLAPVVNAAVCVVLVTVARALIVALKRL